MDEKYTDLAVRVQEVDSRCKSNEHRIDEHDKNIVEIRNKQEAIYELTSAVKSIAQDLSYIKEDVGEVKTKQTELNDKVIILENRQSKKVHEKIESLTDKLIWLFIAGIAGFLLAQAFPGMF